MCPVNSLVNSAVIMNVFYSCSGRLGTCLLVGMALYHRLQSPQGSHLPYVLFFRWYQRDWFCSHQDVYEAQKYRVQTPAVLKVSGSVPGLELRVGLSFTAGGHLKLFTSTGFSAAFWPCHWEQQLFSPQQHTRCCEHAGFHACSGDWACHLNHCWFLLLSAEQAAANVTNLSLFQDFKLCH